MSHAQILLHLLRPLRRYVYPALINMSRKQEQPAEQFEWLKQQQVGTSPLLLFSHHIKVYTCSGDEPTNAQLPNSATDVVPSQATVDRIKRTVSKMSSVVGTAPIIKEQACFLPGTSDGVPCIGKVPDTQGVYLATGHGVWGILNSPATGAALAELIIDGKCTLLDLSDFDPARLL